MRCSPQGLVEGAQAPSPLGRHRMYRRGAGYALVSTPGLEVTPGNLLISPASARLRLRTTRCSQKRSFCTVLISSDQENLGPAQSSETHRLGQYWDEPARPSISLACQTGPEAAQAAPSPGPLVRHRLDTRHRQVPSPTPGRHRTELGRDGSDERVRPQGRHLLKMCPPSI